jgi:hypothetical protein
MIMRLGFVPFPYYVSAEADTRPKANKRRFMLFDNMLRH